MRLHLGPGHAVVPFGYAEVGGGGFDFFAVGRKNFFEKFSCRRRLWPAISG
jgi:hypothetical protein